MATSDQILAAQSGDLIAMSDLMDTLMPWVGRLCGSIALDAGRIARPFFAWNIRQDFRRLRKLLEASA